MLLLLAAGLAAAPPVGSRPLPPPQGYLPVGHHYGVRFQQILVETVGGPRAPTVFGPVVAEADLHWRLLAATGRGVWLDEADAERWVDTATAGVLLGSSLLVDETVARAPQVQAIRTALDTVLSPGVEVARDDGRLAVRHRTGGPERRRVELAELDDATPLGPRPPSVDLGFAWDLRDEDEPERAPLIGYAPYLSLTEVGLSNLRVDARLRTGQWAVTGRERLLRGFYVLGAVRSVEAAPELGSWSTGVLWNAAWMDGWSVRLDRIVAVPEPDVRYQLTVRCERHTPAPGRPDRSPGGAVDEAPWLPAVPARDPPSGAAPPPRRRGPT